MQQQQQPSHSVLPLPAAVGLQSLNSDERFLIGCAERAQAEGNFQQRDQLLQLLASQRYGSRNSNNGNNVNNYPSCSASSSLPAVALNNTQQQHNPIIQQQQHEGALHTPIAEEMPLPPRPLSPNSQRESRRASSNILAAPKYHHGSSNNADSILSFRAVTNDNDSNSNTTGNNTTQEGSSAWNMPSDSRRSYFSRQSLSALESLISDHGFSSVEEALTRVQQFSLPCSQSQQANIIVQRFCAAAAELFLVELVCARHNQGPLSPEHNNPRKRAEEQEEEEEEAVAYSDTRHIENVNPTGGEILGIPIQTVSSNTPQPSRPEESGENTNTHHNTHGATMSISSQSVEATTAKDGATTAIAAAFSPSSPATASSMSPRNIQHQQKGSALSIDGAQLSIATFPVLEATRGAASAQAQASTTLHPPLTKSPSPPPSRLPRNSSIVAPINTPTAQQQQQHPPAQQQEQRKKKVSNSDTPVVTALDLLERSLSIFNPSTNPNASLFPMDLSESAVRVARKARQSSSSFGCWCINGYVFVEQLGKGGQGSVWKALDQKASEETGRDKFVAIKIVPRQKLQKQNRTANLFGPLAGHPSDTDFDMPCFTGSLTERPSVVGRNNTTVESSPLGAGMSALKHAYAGGPATDTSLNLIVEMVVGLIKHESLLGVDEIIDDPKSEYVLLVSRLLDGPPARIVEGGGLDMGALTPLTVARYAHNIASALEQLHSCGIVHCDIKLDNMLVDKARNRLVLGDFGLAAVQQGECVVLGGGNGTPAFWAPELFQRTQHQDGARSPVAHTKESDCYSLGVCLYTLLFGRFPYWTDRVRDLKSWRAVIPGSKQEMVVLPSVWSGPHATKTLAEPGQREAFGRLRIVIEQLLHPVPSKRMAAASIVKWTEVLLQRIEQ